MYHVYPKGPQYTRVDQGKDDKFKFGTDRPWNFEFLQRNKPVEDKLKRALPVHEPIKDWSFFKGDRVRADIGIWVHKNFSILMKMYVFTTRGAEIQSPITLNT